MFEGEHWRSLFREDDLRGFHSKYHIPLSVTLEAPREDKRGFRFFQRDISHPSPSELDSYSNFAEQLKDSPNLSSFVADDPQRPPQSDNMLLLLAGPTGIRV